MEINAAIPKENLTTNSSRSANPSLSQFNVPQITPNSTTSTTSNEERVLGFLYLVICSGAKQAPN